ncbi:isoform aa [Phaffia rhodozyma]|uniref:Isoform aa n=1 Tax=Phaffia rhodozyma TaxID=264483 RepID=A0A0F7SHL8_PHARH|nr:isoform aa [Phaffia rhodozyma]
MKRSVVTTPKSSLSRRPGPPPPGWLTQSKRKLAGLSFSNFKSAPSYDDHLFCTSTSHLASPLSNPLLPPTSLAFENQAWLQTGPDPRMLDVRARKYGLDKDFHAAHFAHEGIEVWDLLGRKALSTAPPLPPPIRSESVKPLTTNHPMTSQGARTGKRTEREVRDLKAQSVSTFTASSSISDLPGTSPSRYQPLSSNHPLHSSVEPHPPSIPISSSLDIPARQPPTASIDSLSPASTPDAIPSIQASSSTSSLSPSHIPDVLPELASHTTTRSSKSLPHLQTTLPSTPDPLTHTSSVGRSTRTKRSTRKSPANDLTSPQSDLFRIALSGATSPTPPVPPRSTHISDTKHYFNQRIRPPLRKKLSHISLPPTTASLADLQYILPASAENKAPVDQSHSSSSAGKAIRQYCLEDKTAEAIRLFEKVYPGHSPSMSSSYSLASSQPSSSQQPSINLYLFIINALIRTNQHALAQGWMSLTTSKQGAEYSTETYLALFRLFTWSRDHAAAHELYNRMMALRSNPLEDKTFARTVMRFLMRAGPAEKDSSISWYWLREMQAKEIPIGFEEWTIILRAHAYASELDHVQSVWRLARETAPISKDSPIKERVDYTRFLTTYLDAHRRMGGSWEELRELAREFLADRAVIPDGSLNLSLMRAACKSGFLDDARQIMKIMEDRAGIAPDSRHFTTLIVELINPNLPPQPGASKAVAALPLTKSAVEKPLSGSQRVKRTARQLSREIFALIGEMQARHLSLEYPVYINIIRYLSSDVSTKPKAIELCRRLISTLPGPGEGWSTENKWAKRWSINSPDPVTGIFTELVNAYAAQTQPGLVLETYEQLKGKKAWEVSLKIVGTLLDRVGSTISIKEQELLWRSAVVLAQEEVESSSSVERRRLKRQLDNGGLPVKEDPSITAAGVRAPFANSSSSLTDSLIDPSALAPRTPASPPNVANTTTRTPIALPTGSYKPPSSLLSRPLTAYIRSLLSVPSRPGTYQLRYITEQCLGITKLGFGLDSTCWSYLALAYVEAGLLDEAFFVLNDVILFKHEHIRRQYEAWTGRTLEGETLRESRARLLDKRQLFKGDFLCPSIERHTPEFKEMTLTSYRMFTPDKVLRRIKEINDMNRLRLPWSPDQRRSFDLQSGSHGASTTRSDDGDLIFLTESDLSLSSDGPTSATLTMSPTAGQRSLLTAQGFDPKSLAPGLWLPHRSILSALSSIVKEFEARAVDLETDALLRRASGKEDPRGKLMEWQTTYRRAWRFIELWRRRGHDRGGR